ADRVGIRVASEENDVSFVGGLREHLLEALRAGDRALLAVRDCLRLVHQGLLGRGSFPAGDPTGLPRRYARFAVAFTTGKGGRKIEAKSLPFPTFPHERATTSRRRDKQRCASREAT